jgi:hypothetical protein
MENTPAQNESRPPFSGTAIILLIIAIIVILGAAALFLLRRPNQPTMPTINDIKTNTKTPTTTNTAPSTTTIPNAIKTPETPTSTTEIPKFSSREELAIACGLKASDAASVYNVGERITVFINDPVYICDPTKFMNPLTLTAKEFGDSRCPSGVQCIWAGEQNVKIDAFMLGGSDTLNLSTLRAKTAKFRAFTIILHEINDGKGGTYAEIETNHE